MRAVFPGFEAVFIQFGIFQDAELSPAESCRFQEGPSTERLYEALSVSTEPLN
jgi:hypothetical protein